MNQHNLKTPTQTTAEFCAVQAAEIETLRGLVAVTASRLGTVRQLAATCEHGFVMSQPLAEEIAGILCGILAGLAQHEGPAT